MKQLITFIMVLAISTIANAQGNFEKREMIAGADTLLYQELTPLKVEKDKKYPLVIFLHGMGERGTDNERQLTHGAQQFLNPKNREKYPCYVVFPQCSEQEFGAYTNYPKSLMPDQMDIPAEPSRFIKRVYGLVSKYVRDGIVDPNRVYVIGLSMGAMATYDIVIRYPNAFAAAVPICGSVNVSRITKAVKGTKWHIFHGDNDKVVPLEGSRQAYLKLREVGAKVEYTEFPGVGHGSWNPAFSQPDFLEWLFNQSRIGKFF